MVYNLYSQINMFLVWNVRQPVRFEPTWHKRDAYKLCICRASS